MDWTFGIPTDGLTNPHFHRRIVNSIVLQRIPNYEIIFCVEKGIALKQQWPNRRWAKQYPMRVIHSSTQKEAWITHKKNLIAQHAKYPNLCLLHDYFILGNDWHQGYLRFGEDWNVCSNVILTQKGKRLWDWTRQSAYGHALLDYTDYSQLDKMYVSGGFFCVKRDYFLANPLNEDLVWGQAEDVEWSNRIKTTWNLKFNPYSMAKAIKKKELG